MTDTATLTTGARRSGGGASGPVAPVRRAAGRAPAAAVLDPDGLWGGLQSLNREATLPEAFRQLEEAGNLHNFRVAAGDESGAYRGKLYLDSDVYKTLEAVAWELGRQPSSELDAWQREVTDLVARAQRPDGYLNTYVQVHQGEHLRYADLDHGHELFCGGHLIQAGVAQARSTGRTELLDVARRYADHLVATFGPGRLESTDGHPEIEMALVELYRETGEQRYLDLGRFLVDVRGHGVLGDGGFGSRYFQDDEPVRSSKQVRGHAVRQVFLSAGAVDLHLETGEDDLLAATTAQWDDMVDAKTYLTGGIGSRWEGESFGDAFELPSDVAYAETCAAHGSVLWSWRLLLATGEARYADLIERTLYNGFASGLSLDGTRFFYVNALQNRAGAAGQSTRDPRHGRQAWYGTACCPPNVMRTLASLHHYLATTDESGVQLQQLAAARVEAHPPQGEVVLDVASGLPWDGRVTVTVTSTPDQAWTLSVRVPAWAEGAEARLGDEPLGDVDAGGYLRLERTWSAGDVVSLTLPVEPRLTWPDPRIDALRGQVAVERGPLVYAVELVDQPEGTDLDLLALDVGAPLRDVEQPGLLGGVVTVVAQGVRLEAPAGPTHLPYGSSPPAREAAAGEPAPQTTEIVAVPYFRWANRRVGPMRVFLPARPASLPTAEENR